MLTLFEGTRIDGKYRLERLLARGGMGSIWVGQDERLRRPVAIKFMEPEFASSAEARSRFEREAQAAAQLMTPHVVQIFDHGVDGDTPYIVMELLEGEDLAQRLKRHRRMSLAAATKIAAQVAKALRRAHEAGIVHRDLKPQNVFLARSDDEEVVKVLDFGVAKRFREEDDGETTRTGSVLGSPKYMSPEQARGLKGVDHRSDLWSLGVILYRAVTGQTPFSGESVGDLIVKICSDPIRRPSEIVPSLSPAVDLFFERALARDPAQRFQTAAELVQAFASLAGETLEASLGAVPAAAVDAQPPSVSAPWQESSSPSQVSASSALEASVREGIGTLSNVSSAPALPRDNRGARPALLGVLGVGTFVVLATIGFLTIRSRPSPAPASPVEAATVEASIAIPPPPAPTASAAPSDVPAAQPAASDAPSAAPPIAHSASAKATAAQAPKAAPPPAKKKTQWGY